MKLIKNIFQNFFQPHYLPIIIAPVILFSPVLFTGKALFWGTPSTQFIPWWKWSFDTVLSGSLPLWNPLLGMGAPLIANYQSALFYPATWIYFLFYLFGGISAFAWSQAFLTVLHLIGSGMGMAFLARKIGLGKFAQTISGLTFSLSGYLVARAWFASINTTAAWLPWVLFFSHEILEDDNKISPTLTLGFVIGLQLLAGHAQTTWYTWVLAFVWVGFWTWHSKCSHGFKRRIRSMAAGLTRLSMAVIIGCSIAAVQLFPTAAYLVQSHRASSAAYEAAMTYSFWPWRILGLIAPDIFGSPVDGNYWGYGNYWEDALYLGMGPLLLALSAIIRSVLNKGMNKGSSSVEVGSPQHNIDENELFDIPQPLRRLPRLLLGIIAVSFILALGKNTPVYPWLYHHIPTFNMFQSPTRFTIWIVFSLSLAAGIGFETWRRPVNKGLYWTRLATAGAFAIMIGAGVGSILLNTSGTELKPTFVPAFALAGLWSAGMGLLSLTAPTVEQGTNSRHLFWKWGVVVWVLLDLITAGLGLNPGIDIAFYSEEPPNAASIREMAGNGRLFLLTNDEYEIKYERFFRFDSFEPELGWHQLRESLLPNINLLEEIPAVNNYDPLVPKRYAKWMERIAETNVHMRGDLLDRMNVSILEWAAPSSLNGVRFVPREVGLRVRWAACAIYVLNEDDALDRVFSGRLDPEKQVVIEGDQITDEQPCDLTQPTIEFVTDNTNEITVKVAADRPGWLVLSDVWYAGWKAWVDGKPVPIYHADYLFRGVRVPAGEHRIQFAYRPPWFFWGGVLSLLTFIGAGMITLYRKT
jgi:hypothetical protein